MTRYDFSFQQVIGHEGGFTNRHSDPGNWTGGNVGAGELKGTKFGISAASYPTLDIKGLTLNDAKEIYRRDFYAKSGADLCPSGVDFVVFDAAVNTGRSRAIKWLQTTAGVKPDGAIGPKTRNAVIEAVTKDPHKFVCEFHAQRIYHHMLLDKMDDEYGLGWSRRLASVLSVATRVIEGVYT